MKRARHIIGYGSSLEYFSLDTIREVVPPFAVVMAEIERARLRDSFAALARRARAAP